MLAYLENSTWTRWTNQPRPLNGEGSYQLPANAEAVYGDDDLAAYGLSRVTPATVPDGKVMVSSTIEDQNGVPVEVGAFEDAAPPPFEDLSRPAFLFMMHKIGVSDTQVESIISQMPETTQAEKDAKALALIVFQNQQTFRRDNPLLDTLTAAAGLDSATVDSAWRAAEQLSW